MRQVEFIEEPHLSGIKVKGLKMFRVDFLNADPPTESDRDVARHMLICAAFEAMWPGRMMAMIESEARAHVAGREYDGLSPTDENLLLLLQEGK